MTVSYKTGRLCIPCDMNPDQLACSCKGYWDIGICSHCIAVNHWSQELDLNEIMTPLEGEKRKKGGFREGVPCAQPSSRRASLRRPSLRRRPSPRRRPTSSSRSGSK